MIILKALPLCAAALALTGCGVVGNLFGSRATTGTDSELTDTSPGVDVSRLDVEGEADFVTAYQFVAGLTETSNAPSSGSADYVGGMGANASGDVEGFMTGALDVRVVDFGTGAVVGDVSEFTVYGEDGTAEAEFSGAVTLNGSVTDTALAMDGTGTITDNASSESALVTLDMDGVLRNQSITDRASAATGDVTGNGAGDLTFTLDDGRFYLVGD